MLYLKEKERLFGEKCNYSIKQDVPQRVVTILCITQKRQRSHKLESLANGFHRKIKI
jgi:intein/homing endonuclease